MPASKCLGAMVRAMFIPKLWGVLGGVLLVGGCAAPVCDPNTGGIDTGAVDPRPIAPLSTATVASRRPTLRWTLGAGADGARVEICSSLAYVLPRSEW